MNTNDTTIPANKKAIPRNGKANNSKKIVSALVASILVFILFSVFSNLSIFDESLNPELTKKLDIGMVPAENENAYFAIWGFEATEGKDIIQSGIAIDEHHNGKLSNDYSGGLPEDEYVKIMGGIHLDNNWLEQIDYCTSRKKLNCTSILSEQLINRPITSPRLTLMLSRYQTLTKMTEFQASSEKNMASSLPPYGNLMKLRRVNLAMAFQKKNTSDFASALKQDMQFWRMLLEKGDTLIDKMIAIASLWSNIQAISEYISKNQKLTNDEISLLLTLLAPLTPNQLDIGNAFLYEQAAFINTLRTLDPESLEMAYGLNAKPIYFLIQPNATFNDYYQYFTKPNIELAKLTAPDFKNRINETQNGDKVCCFKEMNNLAYPFITNIYNLGGKLLLSASSFQAHDYISRVHDLNGMFSLVRLELELSSSEDLVNTINHSKEKQPYNLQPMNYNQELSIISFECLNKGSECKIAL